MATAPKKPVKKPVRKPKPSDLGTGGASKAGNAILKRNKRIMDI